MKLYNVMNSLDIRRGILRTRRGNELGSVRGKLLG